MSVRNAVASVDPATVNVVEFCELHGIARSSYYRLRARFEAGGLDGLEPQSRAPLTVANRTGAAVEDEIVSLRKELADQGLDAGPETIHAHLQRRNGGLEAVPSMSTIWRILTRRGLVTPNPKLGGRRRWKRFQADRANECWQSDATHWFLTNGTIVEIINVVDDCSRVLVASQAVLTVTAEAVRTTLITAATTWGWPERHLSDNGPPFKANDDWLAAIGIVGRHSTPYHPQTCGKVERFHQTLKKHLATVGPFDTVDELQHQLDWFAGYYNTTRPHRALNRHIPLEIWTDTPKSGPRDLPIAAPTRAYRGIVRDGRVQVADIAISVGARHNATPVTAIITAIHCHVFDNDGALIRYLPINPTTYSQPLHNRPGRPTT